MITQGFANELYHISNYFNCEVKADLQYLGKTITSKVFGRYISIHYKGELIWQECLDEQVGNFGIESMQHIFYIVDKMEKGDEDWKNLVYIEKNEDLNKFYKEEYLKMRNEILEFSKDNDSKNKQNQPEEQ